MEEKDGRKTYGELGRHACEGRLSGWRNGVPSGGL